MFFHVWSAQREFELYDVIFWGNGVLLVTTLVTLS